MIHASSCWRPWREFALEQLTTSGEEAAIRARHAVWCLALTEAVGLDLEAGRAQAAWLARLDPELDNVPAALAWFDAADEPANVLRLLAIPGFWAVRPYHAEVRNWLESALHAAPDAPAPIRVKALFAAALTTSFLGDAPAAVAYAEEGLALARELGDPLALGRAHFAAGLAWAFSDNLARAAVAYEEAVSLLRATGVPSWEAMALGELGDTRLMTGDVAEAVPLLDEALALLRRVENPFGIAVILGERAHAARIQGDQVLASRLFAESIAVAAEISSERTLLGAVAGLAGVALAMGQPERAIRILSAVEAAGKSSAVGRIAHAAHTARILAEARTRLPEPVFAAAWDEGRQLSFDEAVADARAIALSAEPKPQREHDDAIGHAHFHLGVIAWVQGDDARARSMLRDAVERYDRFATPADAIDPLRYLGLIACAAGDLDEATVRFAEEVTRLRQQGRGAAIAVGLADVATLATAREAWQPAARLFAKAEALLQAEAAAFSLPARDHYEQAYARAREALGDSARAVDAAGRALTLEQALAEAEAVLDRDTGGDAPSSLIRSNG